MHDSVTKRVHGSCFNHAPTTTKWMQAVMTAYLSLVQLWEEVVLLSLVRVLILAIDVAASVDTALQTLLLLRMF